MSNTVHYTVGNTYKEIPPHRAKMDRTRRFKKIHDWTLFVDILEGNPDLVHRVTFDLGSTFQPRAYACSCPIRVRRHDGQSAWRFSTRQQVYGASTATISLLGVGGSKAQTTHTILFGNRAKTVGPTLRFVETCPGKPMPLLKIDPDQQFGIELELTSPANTTVENIASNLTRKTRGRFGRISVIRSYADAHDTTDVWKLVPDSSIACSRNNPSCTTFELVSPILVGGSGLNQASQVLDALKQIELQVNKSMGFHCHVDVSSLNLQQIIKVCQNAIKYEVSIDIFGLQ
jgi:Putative amidoligase enzyme